MTQKMTEHASNNIPEKTTNMERVSTNSLPWKRTNHLDDNIQHPTATSNNSDTNEDNLNGSDQVLTQ